MVLSIGDILQLSRLAADLYTKAWVVAREAPQEFRDLVHELLLLKDVLFIVHRKVSRDDNGLYSDPTKRVLQQCFAALNDFSVLVAKYEKLALSDRGHWFRRLQWSREQDSIRACRTKLQKYQQLLQLVLTPEGRTILSEESTDDAGHDQDIIWAKPFFPNSDGQIRSCNTTPNHSQKHAFHDYRFHHWENTTSKNQAYVDLLKASWILDELIRERKVAGDLTKAHTRKLVIDLMKALKSDLHHRQRDRSFAEIPETPVLLEQDLSLLESFEQTVEAKENEPRAMDDLTTSQRWITIDKGM
ncbi:MAG: hypothetical protein Q9226_000434 [Calogaya cf. arnoldii]